MRRERLEALQRRLSRKLILEDSFGVVERVVGVDAAYHGKCAVGASVVVGIDSLELIDWAVARKEVKMEYIPGFFAFRELPALMSSLKRLTSGYDLIIVDGHGIAHPRFFGIASHLGLILDKPTIGVAKRLLCGEVSRGRIRYHGRDVGYVTTMGRYVSPGHRISAESALSFVERLTMGTAPEPVRLAHGLAGKEKAKGSELSRNL